MSDIESTLIKLRNINQDAEGEYAVIMYYVNRDLIPNDGTNPPLGICIDCGHFKTRREAVAHRDIIGSKTGAHAIRVVGINDPFALRMGPSDDTIVYNYNDKSSLNEINDSIQRAKERSREIDNRHQKEIEEREDETSMSYLINKMYRCTTSINRAKMLEDQIKVCHRVYEEDKEKIIGHLIKHKEHRDTWKDELTKRLTERGESSLLKTILEGMDKLSEEINDRCQ